MKISTLMKILELTKSRHGDLDINAIVHDVEISTVQFSHRLAFDFTEPGKMPDQGVIWIKSAAPNVVSPELRAVKDDK